MADFSQRPDLGGGSSSTLSIFWLLLTTRPLIGVMLSVLVIFISLFICQCKIAYVNHRRLLSNEALLEAYENKAHAQNKPRPTLT